MSDINKITGAEGIPPKPQPIAEDSEPSTINFQDHMRKINAPAIAKRKAIMEEEVRREYFKIYPTNLPPYLKELKWQALKNIGYVAAALPPDDWFDFPSGISGPKEINETKVPPIRETLKEIHDNLQDIFYHSRYVIKELRMTANRFNMMGPAIPTLHDIFTYYQAIRFDSEKYGRPYLKPLDFGQFERELRALDIALCKYNRAFNTLLKEGNYPNQELENLKAENKVVRKAKGYGQLEGYIKDFFTNPLEAQINTRNKINEYFDFDPDPKVMDYTYMAALTKTKINEVKRIEQAIILCHTIDQLSTETLVDMKSLIRRFGINKDLIHLLSLHAKGEITLDNTTISLVRGDLTEGQIRELLENMNDSDKKRNLDETFSEALNNLRKIEIVLGTLRESQRQAALNELIEELVNQQKRYNLQADEKLLFLEGDLNVHDHDFYDGKDSMIHCAINFPHHNLHFNMGNLQKSE